MGNTIKILACKEETLHAKYMFYSSSKFTKGKFRKSLRSKAVKVLKS